MEEKARVNLFSFIFTTDVENRIHAFIRDQKEGKQNFLSAVLSVKCCWQPGFRAGGLLAV